MNLLEKPIISHNAIVTLCQNKTVLHLGFVGHKDQYEKSISQRRWLHSKIASVAKRLVGIDSLKEEVQVIGEKYGYEVFCGDVMDLPSLGLNDSFDVIVCGELIEHISNPGLMLEGVKKYMHKDSLLIITTPNPWSKGRIKLIKKGRLESEWLNPEHICWYSFETLKNILNRYKFTIAYSGYYVRKRPPESIYKRLRNFIYRTAKSIGRVFGPPKLCLSDGLFFVAQYNSSEIKSDQ